MPLRVRASARKRAQGRAEFGLTNNLSFDLAYSVGLEAPMFRFARTGSTGFGLKF